MWHRLWMKSRWTFNCESAFCKPIFAMFDFYWNIDLLFIEISLHLFMIGTLKFSVHSLEHNYHLNDFDNDVFCSCDKLYLFTAFLRLHKEHIFFFLACILNYNKTPESFLNYYCFILKLGVFLGKTTCMKEVRIKMCQSEPKQNVYAVELN